MRPFSVTRHGAIKVVSEDKTEKTVVVKDSSLKELTVALEQGCSIIAARQLHPRTGKVLWEYELNVEQDTRQNWVPVDWNYRDLTQVSPQDVSVRRAATVESFEYGMSLSKDDFALPMPSDVTEVTVEQ